MTSCQQRLIGMEPEHKGRFGEAVCKYVMKASGVTYVPLCDISGGAPMAVSRERKTILPDFDVAGDGVYAYLDAKVKTQSVRFKKLGQLRHGIDRVNYDAYRDMGALHRKECGLFLIELQDDVGHWSGTILSESFLGLGEPAVGFSNQSHMVYWPRGRFTTIGAYSADDLLRIASGQLSVDMSAILKMAFSAPPPRCVVCTEFRDEPQRDRRGYIKTVCKKCHSFRGWRPGT